MDRRQFIQTSVKLLSAVALSPAFGGCSKGKAAITGTITGPSPDLGHRLLRGDFPSPSREKKIPVVIVGGGIAGLCAGWRFQKAGFKDFEILELEPEVGGVSLWGENRLTAYPWGAHYLPLPTPESKAVRELLEDLEIIQGYQAGGRPIYVEKYLCHAPQERLYIHGKWQDGILPLYGAKGGDLEQFKCFQDLIHNFKNRRGKDGRKAFAIPMEMSSRDRDLLALDQISIRDFLLRHGLDCAPLHWYVNYACRDDYGCDFGAVSAWAGLHYFCSREGGKESEESTVFTWPEGNGWIVKQLKSMIGSRIEFNALVFRIDDGGREVTVDVFYPKENISSRIRAKEVIFACPRRFARFMIAGAKGQQTGALNDFHYSPWLVANLTLKSFPTPRAGVPIAWDNVIYDSPSLGYVVATHQSLRTHIPETVLTYYYAMTGGPPAEERSRLLQTSREDWVEFILKDLSKPHPEIRDLVTRLDIVRWGHAMIQPRVGFIWGKSRAQAARPQGNIYFAHSDLSGFSIFEEAQYRGIVAAERILKKLRIPFSSSI